MSGRPNPLPRWYRWRSNVLQAPVLFLVTGICGTIVLLVSLADKTGRWQHRIARIWARGCLWASWSRIDVRGGENLRKHKVAVYAANHTSYMDTPIVFTALPFQFRILAKKSLWEWPFIGWFLQRSGQMPVDAENPNATLSSLGGAVKTLRSGMSLFVFPEGGRTVEGRLQPFLSGAAYLAIRAQVPLVPIAITGAYDLLPIHTHQFYPSKLRLEVGEPIETKGMTARQIDELTERLRAAIGEMLGQDRAEAQIRTPAAS